MDWRLLDLIDRSVNKLARRLSSCSTGNELFWKLANLLYERSSACSLGNVLSWKLGILFRLRYSCSRVEVRLVAAEMLLVERLAKVRYL